MLSQGLRGGTVRRWRRATSTTSVLRFRSASLVGSQKQGAQTFTSMTFVTKRPRASTNVRR